MPQYPAGFEPVLAGIAITKVKSATGKTGVAVVMTPGQPEDRVYCCVLEDWNEVHVLVGKLFSEAQAALGEPPGQRYLFDPKTGEVTDVPDEKDQH